MKAATKTKINNCEKHPIYCHILENKKKVKEPINHAFAMRLSNIIHKLTKKYKVPVRLFTAIMMQESHYKLSAKNCHKGFRRETLPEVEARCETVEENLIIFGACISGKRLYIKDKVCSDYGIGQIYCITAKSFEMDLDRLTTDLEYSVEASAIVLNDFRKRYSKREQDWWTRYNAKSKRKRKLYKLLVSDFL